MAPAKIFIFVGVFFIVLGLAFSLPFLRFGHLPGDIIIKKQNFTLFIPIGTSLAISLIASLIFYFLSLIKK